MAEVNLFDPTELGREINRRLKLLKPRHNRMDYWMMMYLLYDSYQDNKPLGQRRFKSNSPMTIVDTCHRIISRFPIQWQIAIDQLERTDPDRESLYGDIERSLYGFMEDIDEDLLDRGETIARKHAAYQALLRGMIAVKVHMTTETDRDSGLVYVPYDSRFVLPSYDKNGLKDIICLTPMLAGDVAADYGDKVPDKFNPDSRINKVEIWNRVKTGVAYSNPDSYSFGKNSWLIPPTDHGFFGADGKMEKDRLNKLPFVIRDVNPLPIAEKPTGMTNFPMPLNSDSVPGTMRRMLGNSSTQLWRNAKIPVAERGRSILASIENHVPQFNEAVASIWQSFSLDAFGIYFMQTRGGVVPSDVADALGSGGIIGMERGDTIQRFSPQPMNPAGMQFLDIIGQENEKGTIAGVLQAMGEFRSGFLQARMEQAALNSIEPFIFGHNSWATGSGQLIIDQLRTFKGKGAKISLAFSLDVGSGGSKNFHRVEFDPAVLKDIPRPLVKGEAEPALPADMLERATIANTLVNGKRPLISRSTAQERILRIPDPARENERIWEDIAETDPVVIMEEIATALERRGKEDIAKIFRDKESMMLAMQMMQQMQVQMMAGQLARGGMGGGGNTFGGEGIVGGGRGADNEQPANPALSPAEQPPEFRGEGREQQQGGAPV